MPDVLKPLTNGVVQLGAIAATVYTVPAATTTTVRFIVIANTAAADRKVSMSIGNDAVASRIFSGITVKANDTLTIAANIVLSAAQIIQAFADSGAAVNVHLSGVETTA